MAMRICPNSPDEWVRLYFAALCTAFLGFQWLSYRWYRPLHIAYEIDFAPFAHLLGLVLLVSSLVMMPRFTKPAVAGLAIVLLWYALMVYAELFL